MTQIISRQNKPTFTLDSLNYEEDNWDDIEIPETGLLINNDYELSTTTRDLSGITIDDSSDDESEEDDYFGKLTNYSSSNKSTPVSSSSSSSSSINKVKEMMINSGVVIANNKEEFSGLITRIGGDNNKVIAVGDDWDNDMEIPENGFANLTIANKKNKFESSTITDTDNFESDSWDEEEQDITTKNSITSPRELIIKRIKDPSKILSKSNTAHDKRALESFDDDFDFSEVDLSKLDLSTEALKLHQKQEENLNDKDPFGSERISSRNSSRLSILPSPAPTNGSQSAFESGDDDDLFDDIQFPEHMDSLTLISYNDDNDNFEDGLDIDNESVFDPDRLKNKNIVTRPNPTQQKRTRRESFSIEFNTSSKNSRPPSPSVSHNNNKDQSKATNNDDSASVSSLQRLKTNKAFSKSLTSLKTTTTTKKIMSKSTSPKNQINRSKSPQSPQRPKSPKLPLSGIVKKSMSLTNNTLEKPKSTSSVTNSTNKPSPKKTTINSTLPSNKYIESTPKRTSPNFNKNRHQKQKQNTNSNHNNIYNTTSDTNFNSTTTTTLEIMRKPKKRQSFGDGTELDGFDDLPINIDRERLCTSNDLSRHNRSNSVSSINESNNFQRHRKNKKNRKRKKPQLIKNLNADKNPKVVGEMVYNPVTQRWDGNDSVLKDFDNALASPIRPALISNMNNHTTNAKSFQVVGKMKFDPTKMCWDNNSSDEEEEEIWARFDCDDYQDDFISPPQAFSDISDNDTSFNTKKNTLITNYHQLKNDNSTSDDSDFQVGSEFDITPGFLAALLASERQHRNEITRWYPDALSKKNDSRFGLRDVTLQRSYLYDLKNNNNRKSANKSSSGNNSKIYHNRSGGLFEAARNLTRPERRHFR